MSCVFRFSVKLLWCYVRYPPSRTCLRNVEKHIQIGLRCRFFKCALNLFLPSNYPRTNDSRILCRMEMDWHLALLQHNERWREGRKLIDRSLRPGATSLYQQVIEEKTRGFLGQLLAAPDDFRNHISLSAAILSESNDH